MPEGDAAVVGRDTLGQGDAEAFILEGGGAEAGEQVVLKTASTQDHRADAGGAGDAQEPTGKGGMEAAGRGVAAELFHERRPIGDAIAEGKFIGAGVRLKEGGGFEQEPGFAFVAVAGGDAGEPREGVKKSANTCRFNYM